MYQEFFGFSERPFKSAPAPKLYVPCPAIEHARQTLLRGIERGDGPALVIGPSGTGKSLLAQLLAEQLRSKYHVANLSSARLDSCRALLQNILFELQLPYRELEEGEMRLSLIDFLRRNENESPGLLLLVDEAHTLPLRLLEEIRLITNIVDHGTPRVRLVLFGGAQLEERFASPKLESFNQRIASRSYLQPLNFDETAGYVREQVRKVGTNGVRLFSDETMKAIYRATDGIPRLINQICDHSLMLAFLAGQSIVFPDFVEEAWADLQQLPAPWQAPRGERESPAEPVALENVLEFGTLEDDFPVDHKQECPGRRVESQLDYLSESLHSFSQGNYLSDNFDLEEPTGPSIELQFPAMKNLLAGGQNEVTVECASPTELFGAFEEEEPIVDHYAQLDAAGAFKPRQPTKVSQPVEEPKRSKPVEPVFKPAAEIAPQQEAEYQLAESFSVNSPQPHFEQLAPGIVTSSWDDASAASTSVHFPIDRFVAMIDAIEVSLELDQIEPVAKPLAKTVAKTSPADEPVVPFQVVHQENEFDPANDPVTPELIVEEPIRNRHPADDRDLLVIEGHQGNDRNTPPRRSRYRQLFSSLRRREQTG